jgi:hypothetical protein
MVSLSKSDRRNSPCRATDVVEADVHGFGAAIGAKAGYLEEHEGMSSVRFSCGSLLSLAVAISSA